MILHTPKERDGVLRAATQKSLAKINVFTAAVGQEAKIIDDFLRLWKVNIFLSCERRTFAQGLVWLN